ncbi:MAG: CHAP domain-containing protein [Rickettsiales bacterium]
MSTASPQEPFSLPPQADAEAARLGQAILQNATREVGHGEVRYDNHGPDVARYTSVVASKTYGHAWCAAFASYILAQTAPKLVRPSPLAKGLMAQFQAHGAFYSTTTVYTPQPGDLIFMDRGEGWKGHVGFIKQIDPDGTLHTIEGNKADPRYKGKNEGVDYVWSRDIPDQVREVIYPPNDPERARILGYGSIASMAAAKHLALDVPPPPPALGTTPLQRMPYLGH